MNTPLSSLHLTIDEKSFLRRLQSIDHESTLWGLAISNVASNPEPSRVRQLFTDLRSQAKDNAVVMRSIIGEPGYTELKRLFI